MPSRSASATASATLPCARVARRQHHAVHVLGAERVDRDRGDERRVDAAREADEHVGESRSCARSRACRARALRRPRAPARARARSAPAPARRSSMSTTSRSSTNCLARATSRPAASNDERRAVEHELVLTADEIHVDDRHAGLRGAAREHLLALARAGRRKYGDALMLTISSAPFAAIARIGPGSHASSQIDTRDLHARDLEQRPDFGRRA